MLIKKFKTIRFNYRDKDKYEIIQQFMFNCVYFYVVQPRNMSVINYIVPEFPDEYLNQEFRKELIEFLMSDDKFRGRHRHYTIC